MDKLDNFYYSGLNVIIRKGKDFSKNELKSRLHQMNIDFDLSKSSKSYFSNLYDRALESRANKIKLFDKLKNDTDRMGYITNNKIEIKENRNNFLLNNEDIETPVNINKKGKGKNIIIKDEIIDENQLGYFQNEHNNNYNSFKKNKKSNFTNVLANKIEDNENSCRQNDQFEYNLQNNKDKEIDYEKYMGNNYNQNINLRNRLQNYNYLEKNKINEMDSPPKKYDFNKRYFEYNNEHKQNFSNEKREYNNLFQDYNEKNIKIRKEDNLKQNNTNNNYNFKKINYRPFKNEIKNEFEEDKLNNEIENNDISIQVNNNNRPNLNKRKRYRNYALEKLNEENYYKEEGNQNNESNMENKNYIDLLLYILLVIISGFLIYFIFKIMFRVSNTFTEGVSNTIRIVANPKKLLRDLIGGIIKSILMSIFYDYIFITLPMTIFSIVIYSLKQKLEFNKLCKQIIDDIKKDLENRMDKSMSENNIIDIYSKKYNIDKNVFIKKYLKALYELRRKDHSLKLSQNFNDKGEKEYIWELRH